MLKDRLTSALVLNLPEITNGLVSYCDESRVGLWCVLMQCWKVIVLMLIGNLKCMRDTIPHMIFN